MQDFRYIGPLIWSSFCLIFSFQEDINASVNSDLNKEVQVCNLVCNFFILVILKIFFIDRPTILGAQ
jgi:hypothetical protein